MNEENKEAIPQPAMEPTPEPAAAPVAQPEPALQPEAAPVAVAQPVSAQPMAAPAGYQQPNSTVAVPVSVKSGGTASLVCGILAAALGFFSPVVGVVLGIIAIVQAKKWPGSGKAKAGRICGIIGIVLAVLSFVLGIALTVLAYAIM